MQTKTMLRINAKVLDEELCRQLWSLSSCRGDLCDSFIITLPYIDSYLEDVKTDMKNVEGWTPHVAYYFLLSKREVLTKYNYDSIFFENK